MSPSSSNQGSAASTTRRVSPALLGTRPSPLAPAAEHQAAPGATGLCWGWASAGTPDGSLPVSVPTPHPHCLALATVGESLDPGAVPKDSGLFHLVRRM